MASSRPNKEGMELVKKHFLITGLPGVGKTTLIMKLYEALKSLHSVGFYTEEIREKGVRKGFALVGFDGTRGVLSHVDFQSTFRVGKYGVDVVGFEAFLDTIDFLGTKTRLIIIDEIGKMECFSDKFKRLLTDIFNSHKRLIATIALKGGGVIDEIKKRSDVTLFKIDARNRDLVLSEILKSFQG
jgi:nucleoside-triphosphatase